MILIKIGVISDTHIDKNTHKLDKFIDKSLKNVDMIIHLGDFTSFKVVEKLKRSKKFIGVWGNNDRNEIKKNLKEKEIIKLCGYRIGLFHGHGKGKNTMDRAYETFKNDKVDIIIFGHSHQPIVKTKNKILIINPGSPMRKLKERWFSYVVLNLEREKIEANICFYEKK
ncbi:metallophosphoesterase family protein [Clostridium oceanicum]|uniref:metallophosphoesterase family protein n=1 Tax=Clostridium oceanicum TaxID=1543 RepID=UPI003CD074DD